jgi:DNA-binding transcriptional regulator YhcF (GntR family)
MSGEITGAVLACGPVFSGALRHTLVALGDHADPEGRSYPSIKMIAWSSSVSQRQVLRNIRELERIRLVEVVRRRGKSLNYYESGQR